MEKLNLGENFIKDESIESYEYHEYTPTPGSSNLNQNNEIVIKINHQDLFLDISESYLHFEGRLLKNDDSSYANADKVSLINNALMYLFSNVKYKVSGQEIENLNYPGETTTMMGYLKYSEDFEKTEGLNQLWYRESSKAFGSENGITLRNEYIIKKPKTKGTFSFSVPLKHIFGFCETYNKVMYGFEHEISLYRKQDSRDSVIDEINVNGQNVLRMTNTGKVRLDKLSWYVPHVKPSLEYETKLLTQIRNKVKYEVAYKRFQDASTTINPGYTFDWRLTAKSSPEKPRFIIVGFQKRNLDGTFSDKSLFHHSFLKNIFVSLNSRRYPEVDYNVNFEENKFSRVFMEAVRFKRNCFHSTDSVNISPFDYSEYYPLYVIDVSNQSDSIKGGITDITIKMNFDKKVENNIEAYAVIVSDRIIMFEADGTKMRIVQ